MTSMSGPPRYRASQTTRTTAASPKRYQTKMSSERVRRYRSMKWIAARPDSKRREHPDDEAERSQR